MSVTHPLVRTVEPAWKVRGCSFVSVRMDTVATNVRVKVSVINEVHSKKTQINQIENYLKQNKPFFRKPRIVFPKNYLLTSSGHYEDL